MPTTKTLVQSPTIGAIENADLLWVWDVTASTLNKVTRENLIGGTAVISGGISGGQTLIGGTAANDDLTLEGTSNATRTTSYVVLQPNGGNVGIGTVSPSAKLTVSSSDPIALRLIRSGFASNSGTIEFANSNGGQGYLGVSTNSKLAIASSEDLVSGTNTVITFDTSNKNVGIGTTSPDTRLDIDAGAIEFAEMTAPAGGAANTGRLFCRDNGSGKTQLCVIFNTGAIQVIATQP